MPSNVRQLLDNGVPVYPITDKSLVIGLQDVPFESYVVAWDGASTPVPANIPAGVVVTYNTTDYTGTLAAGSATAPYLYLVASASQQGEYDRYIVTHTGSTYAWTQLGSTAPVSPVIADDLTTNDASKALSAKQGKILGDKTSELEAKVTDLNKWSGKYIIPVTEHYYINLSGGVGTTAPINAPIADAGARYAIQPCEEGDLFIVNGTSGNQARLWAFLDSNNVILSVANAYVTGDNLYLTAPEDAASIVLNSYNTRPSYYSKKDGVYADLHRKDVTIDGNIETLSEHTGLETIPVTKEQAFINLSGGVGTTVPSTYVSSAAHRYFKYPCSAGDLFVVNGTGGSSPRLWGFADTNDVILSVANANVTGTNLHLVAPANSAYIIINDGNTGKVSYYSEKGSVYAKLYAEMVAGDTSLATSISNAVTGLDKDLRQWEGKYTIPMTANFYINLSGGVGSVAPISSPIGNIGVSYGIQPCTEGDIIIVNGTSGVQARLWAFLDVDNKILSVAEQYASGNNLYLTAPANATSIVLNNYDSRPSYYSKRDGTFADLHRKDVTIDSNIQNLARNTGLEAIPVTREQGYINLSGGVGSAVPSNYTSAATYRYFKRTCAEGDLFIINGTGGNAPRLWAFADADDIILAISSANLTGVNLHIVAPANSAYIIINDANTGGVSYYSANGSVYDRLYTDRVASEKALYDELAKDQSAYNMAENPFLYRGDTKNGSNGKLSMCVVRDNGEIVAYRGYDPNKPISIQYRIVKFALDGTETYFNEIGQCECQSIWKDSRGNVFVSPNLTAGDSRLGVWKLGASENTLRQVLKLYDPNSSDEKVATSNSDSVWSYCEDDEGNLYCGTYTTNSNANGSIYKSTDGGETWVKKIDITESFPQATQLHIHSICWRKWDKCLYAVCGEYNTIYRSTDRGNTWEDMEVVLPDAKSVTLTPTSLGLITTSDSAYNCRFCLVRLPSKEVIQTANYWANVAFAVRVSDITGWIYAFTLIDVSVNSTAYFPPVEALNDPTALQSWKNGSPAYLARWQAYHDEMVSLFPSDAIRPTHCGIFVSKDGGLHWEIVKRIRVESKGNNGYYRCGEFANGECLTYPVKDLDDASETNGYPLVIREGRKKYAATGFDLDGDALIRVNDSTIVGY